MHQWETTINECAYAYGCASIGTRQSTSENIICEMYIYRKTTIYKWAYIRDASIGKRQSTKRQSTSAHICKVRCVSIGTRQSTCEHNIRHPSIATRWCIIGKQVRRVSIWYDITSYYIMRSQVPRRWMVRYCEEKKRDTKNEILACGRLYT